MSTSCTVRCVFKKPTAPARACLWRKFHCSRRCYAEPGTKPAKSPPAGKRKINKQLTKSQPKGLPGAQAYTNEEKTILKSWYTPAQLAAVEAGEAAVDPEDILKQGALRNDPWAFDYIDDFADIDPVIDKPVRAPKKNYDPQARFKNEDEIASDFGKFLQDLPENPTRLDYIKFRDNLRLTVGKEGAERNPISSLAPEIPKGLLQQPGRAKTSGEVEASPAMRRLMRQTGYTRQEIMRFNLKELVSHSVTNQTRMGKINSFYILCIAGNGRGLLGIGEGKAAEFQDAKEQARNNAIRNAQPVPRYEERTIYGNVKVKMGAVELELMARPPGFGVRCQALIFYMCQHAGITDLAARVTRSRNPMNVVKATFYALMNQRIPDEIARGLGRKLVDVRKVYYGRSLL